MTLTTKCTDELQETERKIRSSRTETVYPACY